MIPFIRDDGGRVAAGWHASAGDCATRAAAIATGCPYQDIYDEINRLARDEKPRHGRRRSSARDGVFRKTFGLLMEAHGFRWVPTMGIGTGCTVHLKDDELPNGRLVVSLSGHYAAVVDGTLHDTYDCSRGGTRCVYGYWIQDPTP